MAIKTKTVQESRAWGIDSAHRTDIFDEKRMISVKGYDRDAGGSVVKAQTEYVKQVLEQDARKEQK